jgi:hypothetical protein
MTYNFDPERWFQNESAALDAVRDAGKISPVEHAAAMDRLQEKLEAMWQRLDGTYQMTDDRRQITVVSGVSPASGRGGPD